MGDTELFDRNDQKLRGFFEKAVKEFRMTIFELWL